MLGVESRSQESGVRNQKSWRDTLGVEDRWQEVVGKESILDRTALDPRKYRDKGWEALRDDWVSYLICEAHTGRPIHERVFEYTYCWDGDRVFNPGVADRDILDLAQEGSSVSNEAQRRVFEDTYCSTQNLREAFIEANKGDVLWWQSPPDCEADLPEARATLGVVGVREDGLKELRCWGMAGEWDVDDAKRIRNRLKEENQGLGLRDIRREVIRVNGVGEDTLWNWMEKYTPELNKHAEWISSGELDRLQNQVREIAEILAKDALQVFNSEMDSMYKLQVMGEAVGLMELASGLQVDVGVNTGCGVDPRYGQVETNLFGGLPVFVGEENYGEYEWLSGQSLNQLVWVKIRQEGLLSKTVQGMRLWRVQENGLLEKLIVSSPCCGRQEQYIAVGGCCGGCQAKVPVGVWFC